LNRTDGVDRIKRQIAFVLAADRLKGILRQNRIYVGSRAENAAEHSWHLILTALTLAEHALPGTDISRAIELLVLHDLVEILAGDHHRALKTAGVLTSIAAREAVASEQLFRELPDDQRQRFLSLWQEFAAASTPEARFAHALDSLHPLLMTWGPLGQGSVHHSLNARKVIEYKRLALPALRTLARDTVAQAVERGVLNEE